MPLYKQPKSDYWHIDVVAPNGKRVRRSTGTTDKQQAQEYHDRVKNDLWRSHHLGDKPQRSFDEAALRWLREKSHKRSLKDDKVIIKWFRQHLTMPLHEIRGSMALELVGKLDVSNARRNKYLAVLRAILKRAETAWEWIDKAPSFTLLPTSKRRIRSLSKEKVQRLIAELPDHQRKVVLFALATGLRQSNVLGLTWDHVDLVRRVAWVDAEDFKTDIDHGVPLNDTAVSIIRQCIGQHQTHVFTYRNKPITQANTKAWRAALVRAGIESFRWHDLRHVAATWMVEDGTPLFAVQEMFGWKSESMVRRYAHLSTQHLAVHASGLDTRLSHNLAIPKKKTR
jgi:integrase